ncbi:MAG: lysophospholipid acyltransferase family protein [Candidatus Caldatribacteriota bacterium]|nr:lysophospholipid acyltransferase family protein [Candidatus Caldatribacteriota bacterium]
MFYSITKFIGWILIKLFWKVEIQGIDNVPKKGSLIVAANHTSYLDPIILGITMNRKMHFIAKKEVFGNFIGNFICRKLNAFPVDRGKIDISALKHSINILQNKEVLGIFPEGTRSSKGELQDFKLGIIKIAVKTGSPILPVGIIGTHEIYPQGRIFPSFFKHKIIVHYGSPKYLNTKNNRDKNYQKESLNILSREIKALTSENNQVF